MKLKTMVIILAVLFVAFVFIACTIVLLNSASKNACEVQKIRLQENNQELIDALNVTLDKFYEEYNINTACLKRVDECTKLVSDILKVKECHLKNNSQA